MEYPKKRPLPKAVIAALAIVAIALVAGFVYLGAFVTQKPPKIEASPGPLETYDDQQMEHAGLQLSEVQPVGHQQSPPPRDNGPSNVLGEQTHQQRNNSSRNTKPASNENAQPAKNNKLLKLDEIL